MDAPSDGADWLALTAEPLPLDAAAAWVLLPSCGAVVTFSGHARDHSEGRADVTRLEYEAYEEHVVPALARIAAEIRERWPAVGRLALLHRVGTLAVTDAAVIVAVSAPHRGEAFEAARHGIDALKASAPIWKREVWRGGESWGLEAQHLTAADAS